MKLRTLSVLQTTKYINVIHVYVVYVVLLHNIQILVSDLDFSACGLYDKKNTIYFSNINMPHPFSVSSNLTATSAAPLPDCR